MENRKPLTNDEGEVRELTEEDFATAVPFSALPAELQTLLFEKKHVVLDEESPFTPEEEAARKHIFDTALKAVREHNTDVPQEEIEAAVEASLTWARARMKRR
jgi:GTPase Era involved in 16S rRNA processing